MATVKFNKGPVLPQVTRDYLSNGASEGSRNNALMAAACQMRDADIEIGAAGPQLLDRAMADGLDQSEAVATINSAYKRDAREPIIPGSRSSPLQGKSSSSAWSKPKEETEVDVKVDPLEKEIAGIDLPTPVENGAIEFIKAVFKEGEYISIGNGRIKDGKKAGIDGGAVHTREEWLDFLEENDLYGFNRNEGVFIRVNPMASREGKSDQHVAAYRHALIESDSVPREVQYAIYKRSGLPITAITDSGDASIHAWVRVGAKSREEYDKRVAMIYSLLSNYAFDVKNGNPSRYARLPGGWRPEGEQKLLELNIGAKDWLEWEIEREDDGLPDIASLTDLLKIEIARPKEIIKGILHQGCKLVLGGPSKARKTWIFMDLAISIANGVPWMDFLECGQGRVLYINFELIEFSAQERWKWILEQKQALDLSKELRTDGIDTWNLRGYAASVETMVGRIVRRVNARQYDLVMIDPIYKVLGDRDENAAGQMTEFLNHVEQISKQTGAATGIAAHFPKGNMASRNSMDRIAGSGVFARDPDAILTMTEAEMKVDTDDTEVMKRAVMEQQAGIARFVMDFNLRNFKEVPASPIVWKAPLFSLSEEACKLRGESPGRPKASSHDKLMDALPGTRSELAEKLKVSLPTLDRMTKRAKDQDLIKIENNVYMSA
jgi:RecA-family ATPase